MKYIIWILAIVVVFPASIDATEDRGLLLEGSGDAGRLYKASHALVIGVSDYLTGWPDLPGVETDVQAVKTALEEHGFHVTVIANPARQELDHAFNDFVNQYGHDPENRLLFYFAGHGHTMTLAYGGEMGYIVPTDAPSPHRDEHRFLATAMDMQMIEVYAKRIQAKHALFLFDSCFSGSIFALSRAVPENITYKSNLPVRQFMTSGSADEQVPDESIFRKQFIAALQGEGDVNGDGYVTGTELGEFLQDKVVNYSRGSQHPQYGKIRDPNLDKGDFVFFLPDAISVEHTVSPTPPSSGTVDLEAEMWELVKHSASVADVNDFLTAFPDGQFATVARFKLKQLARQQSQVVSPETQETPPISIGRATPTPVPFAITYGDVSADNSSRYLGDKTWEWAVYLDADTETLAHISCAEYTLHPTFPNPVRLACTPENNFSHQTKGWGTFRIKIRVIYTDGSQKSLSHMLKFEQ